MAEKIKASDIFSGDLTGKAIKEFEALIKVLEKLEEQQKDVLKTSAEGIKVNTKEYEQVKKNVKLINDQEKAEQSLLKTEQQREKLEQERIKTINQGLTQKQKELALAERQAKANARQTREQLKLNGAYDKQSKRLNQLRKQYKNLVVEQGKETKATIKMRKEIQKLDTQLKKVDASAGQFQRSVGNYGKAFGGLKNLASSALPIAGVAGVVSVLKNGLKVIMDFEKANSSLKAITGATDEEMNTLKETAKQLGSTTAFTASQVTELQTEFAKLGFTTKQIDNATASTLNLALASGTTLAESASVVGNTLGGLGLSAVETQRVVDVMAKSFTSSALDMEKFKESMKLVAPASKAVGKSVEETTALLGTLANAGISGSNAGTALRTSFIQLSKAGLTLEQGLEKVANSEDKLATATELVGKNASTAFLVLSEGTETTEELEKAMYNATGTAQEMADTMADNLAGDVDKLKSAWEGFILSLDGSESVIGNLMRTFTQGLTKALTGLMNLDIAFKLILNDVDELSGKDLDRLLAGGWQNEDGTSITELVKQTDDNYKDIEKLLNDEDKLRKEWVKWLGEDEDDAIALFNRYFHKRLEFLNQPKEVVENLENQPQASTSGSSSRGAKMKGVGTRDLVEKQLPYELLCKSAGGTWDRSKQTCSFDTKSMGLSSDSTFQEGMCKKAGGTWDNSSKTCTFEVNVDAETKNATNYQEVLTEIVDRETQKRIELIDKEIQANEKRQTMLQELAGKGIQDAKENLAEEKKQQAELERERERALKRQQQIELGLAVLNSYTNNLENDVDNPLAKTITDTQVLLQFVRSLPTFYDGTEDTGQGGKLDNKGGFHAILHPNERVMTAEENAPLKGISNIELSNLGKAYKKGVLSPVISVDNTEVVNKLDEIAKKPTYLGRDYDATEKAIIETIARKGRIERNHKKTGKNLF